jgi:hypothetical protein
MELMTTHTPAPWKVIGHFIGTDEPDPQTIAYLDDHRNRRARPHGETEANGLLIAAAPIMLKALLAVASDYDGMNLLRDEVAALVRDAIAQAKPREVNLTLLLAAENYLHLDARFDDLTDECAAAKRALLDAVNQAKGEIA